MIAISARGENKNNNTHRGMDGRSARGESLRRLSDTALLRRIEKLRGSERAVLVKTLYSLNEIERRRLYLPRGYASLYEFCTDYLKYSRSAAMRRIHAARCIARFPQVASLLRSGELTLTAASMIAGIITQENADEIISCAVKRSSRELELLVSRHRPELILRDRVRAVSVMVPEINNNISSRFPGAGKNSSQRVDNKPDKNRGLNAKPLRVNGCDAPPAAESKAVGSIITGSAQPSVPACGRDSEKLERVRIAQKYKLQFAVDPEFMEKLAKVKSLLSTKYPKGMDFQTVFNILMSEYIDHHDPERKIRTRKPGERQYSCPRGRKTTEHTRHIPQKTRDEVFKRDGGRCSFVGSDGKRCGSRWDLEIDHIVPYARGGDHSPENLRLLCGAHNRLAAEQSYGKNFMERYYLRE